MGLHWDGTVTLGNVLMVLAVLWPVIRFSVLMRDFPPHRHVKDGIIYPKGMVLEKEVDRGK